MQEILQKRLKAVQGGRERVAVLRKLAQLSLEKLQSSDDAIGYLQQVLELQPGDLAAQQDLERLLEQSEKWYDLVEVLVRHADASQEAGKSDEEVVHLLRAAEIWEVKVQAPEQAKKLLERVLERDPSHVRALMSLARIYETQHDWPRCKATLERAVRLARGGAEMAELYYRGLAIPIGDLGPVFSSHSRLVDEQKYRRRIDLGSTPDGTPKPHS